MFSATECPSGQASGKGSKTINRRLFRQKQPNIRYTDANNECFDQKYESNLSQNASYCKPGTSEKLHIAQPEAKSEFSSMLQQYKEMSKTLPVANASKIKPLVIDVPSISPRPLRRSDSIADAGVVTPDDPYSQTQTSFIDSHAISSPLYACNVFTCANDGIVTPISSHDEYDRSQSPYSPVAPVIPGAPLKRTPLMANRIYNESVSPATHIIEYATTSSPASATKDSSLKVAAAYFESGTPTDELLSPLASDSGSFCSKSSAFSTVSAKEFFKSRQLPQLSGKTHINDHQSQQYTPRSLPKPAAQLHQSDDYSIPAGNTFSTGLYHTYQQGLNDSVYAKTGNSFYSRTTSSGVFRKMEIDKDDVTMSCSDEEELNEIFYISDDEPPLQQTYYEPPHQQSYYEPQYQQSYYDHLSNGVCI